MKINSVLTECVDSNWQVLSYSKTTYKIGHKPIVEKLCCLFEMVEPKIREHMSVTKGVTRFVVTISTTKGKFVKTYRPHQEF